MDEPLLILIPGMGADERVFRAQQASFANLRIPAWIKPLPSETLICYARRFAKAIDPGQACFIGGASFGGILALEMAARVKARAVFLIGSIRSPAGMHWGVRAVRPLARLTLALPFPILGPLAELSLYSCGRYSNISTRSLLRQISDADASFLRWAVRAVLDWQPSTEVGRAPIYQIHGAKDRVFPARLAAADELVGSAGHLISVTHGQAVNQFIADRMRNSEIIRWGS
jgi:pimeloyl-ACP methyl ester carboxylesterase